MRAEGGGNGNIHRFRSNVINSKKVLPMSNNDRKSILPVDHSRDVFSVSWLSLIYANPNNFSNFELMLANLPVSSSNQNENCMLKSAGSFGMKENATHLPEIRVQKNAAGSAVQRFPCVAKIGQCRDLANT